MSRGLQAIDKPHEPNVLVSVIVPARNEEARIGRTVTTLSRVLLECGVAFEILVVDHGSLDCTTSMAEQAGAVVVDGQDMPTVAAVRNLGARLSRGRLLCFVDADVTVTKSWAIRVTELASATGPDDMFVTGAEVRSEGIATWIDRSWFGISGRDLSHINSGNLLVSRHYFLSLGGFDARLLSGEDYELCTRAKSHGGKVVSDDSLIALHTRQPDSLGSFLKREFWHGAGDFQSWATFRESKIAWACTLLLASVVFSVAGAALMHSLSWLFIPWALLLAIALVAAFRRPRRHAWDLLPLWVLYAAFLVARTASPIAVLIGSRGDSWRGQ